MDGYHTANGDDDSSTSDELSFSQVQSAKRAAKLCLWSPFLGILVCLGFDLLAQFAKAKPLTTVIIAASAAIFVWCLGIVYGIQAFRKIPVVGKRGILGRAIFGTSLDALLVLITVLGLVAVISRHQKNMRWAASQSAGGNAQGEEAEKIATVRKEFWSEMAEARKAALAAWREVINPSVLDMSTIKAKSDLETRKAKLRQFLQASAANRKVLANDAESLEALMTTNNVSPKSREAILQDFNERIQPVLTLLEPSLNAEARTANAMLSHISFLEDHWGEWYYAPATRRVTFRKSNLIDPYNRLVAAVKKESADADDLRQKFEQALFAYRRGSNSVDRLPEENP